MKNSLRELNKIIKNIYKVMILTIKSSKRSAIALIVANVFIGAFIPCNLIIWKYIINTATASLNGESITPVFIWLALWGANICIINLGDRICSYFQGMQAKYMNKYITNCILEKIDKLEMSYFDVPENYDKADKASGTATANTLQILGMVVSAIRSISTLMASIVVIITLDFKIIIIAIFSILPVFYIDLKNYNKGYEIYCSRVPKLRYIGYLRHILLVRENIKEIKVFRANKFFKDKIINKTNEYIEEDKKLKKYMIKRETLADCLQHFLSYINKAYIIFIFVAKRLTIGDLTLYIESLNNLEEAMRSTLNAISSIYSDNLYIDDLFIFLNEKEKDNSSALMEFPKEFKEIRFEHVYFRYPGTEYYVLKDINLTIIRNKKYAIVGENGSGKTTLIKLFMGLYTPTKGKIYIDDVDIQQISRESLFRNIGVIFQDFIKYPLTVKENIGIGNIENIDDEERIFLASQHAGISEYIEKLSKGYDTQLQKEWDEGVDLSLGQWQKIAISRALVSDSEITILDEPTAALDPKAEYELFNTLKQLMSDRTCLFITHRFANVHIANEIIVLGDGQIVELGSHQTLIKENGIYAELYHLQAEAYVS